LHFGLGSTDAVDRVVIRWPGGAPQVLQGLAADRRYRIEQGADSAVEVPRRDIRIADSPPTAPQVPAFAPIVLRIPLRLPPSLAGALTGVAVRDSSPRADSRGTLMVPWAQWCAPCIEELRELVRRQKELLDAGLQILPVNLDENADREKAERLFKEKIEPLATGDAAPVSVNAADSVKEALDAVLMHVRDEESGPWPMPVSLLIDKNRTLQVVYVGPVSPKQLAADLRSYCGDQPPKLALRGRFEGRWYFRSPRDWDSLARDLEKRGLIEDARFIKNTYLTGAREDP